MGRTSATQTPCENHSVLCINPYNWTFRNCKCNIIFIMDQSTNKTTKESDCYKQCMDKPHKFNCEPGYSHSNKTIVWVVRKVGTNLLLANLVCFEVQRVKSLSILVLHINWKQMNWYIYMHHLFLGKNARANGQLNFQGQWISSNINFAMGNFAHTT